MVDTLELLVFRIFISTVGYVVLILSLIKNQISCLKTFNVFLPGPAASNLVATNHKVIALRVHPHHLVAAQVLPGESKVE
jgi:hypothetical protein